MANENLESKRWLIAGAAVIIQLCLGTVYAWSVFKNPLMQMHGWEGKSVQYTFMLLMLIIGLAAAFGGTLVDKKGPRFVATIGGILFGIGTLVAGYADQVGNIYLLYLGFGVIAALGNGFGYVTPIATLIRWFPDKRGLVTGLAVMGFGAGAFFMGKIAPVMIKSFQQIDPAGTMIASGVANTWYIWGIIFLILVTGSAQLFKNPPAGWLPKGFTPAATTVSAADSFTFGEAVKTRQWWMLWAMLCLNVSAGLGLISQHSPLAQDIYKKTYGLTGDLTPEQVAIVAAAGGAVVAYAAIFNGLGRLFWAKISDNIGRKMVFLIMFATQAVLYVLVAKGFVATYWLFVIASCYLLACYGGGFATMPAFAADAFGPAYIGKVYGFMLTAWSTAGIIGPYVFEVFKPQALTIAAGLLTLGFVIALIYTPPKGKKA
ncbi:MAG TPA: OFA family MFS transporter [Smithella sp.]|jgi:OFA family oxalate/formate antiporter-like MFS transporter|nr:OFA family MFS transporter [Smithella sp.]OQC53289.1 MAG: putative MFS-type transporter YhjX [Deltaproteobacteria bacterium ADurb.Bin022]HNQ65089.1 OFA family MFS transporter [Smithella sp.]HOE33008.1 OFA family MFS transporter [Smithella sp.]HOG10829.1 OFA family MFS transporter [Smithella sp.]